MKKYRGEIGLVKKYMEKTVHLRKCATVIKYLYQG